MVLDLNLFVIVIIATPYNIREMHKILKAGTQIIKAYFHPRHCYSCNIQISIEISISMESIVFSFINQKLHVLTPVRRRDLGSQEKGKCYGDSFLSLGLIIWFMSSPLHVFVITWKTCMYEPTCFTGKRTVGYLLCYLLGESIEVSL